MSTNTDIQERKLELIQWLSVIDDAAILDKIFELRTQDNQDWWDDISEAEQESILLGVADADAGNLKPHTEARIIYEKRL